ncbi:hypothetical protein Scep_018580 [Stephania cephalantha]|uniref:Uncharacterized protein n=1 Tax=Stephania cephalantha TaxID=152367 RepID=A0AAP0IA51_9MAGN
MDLGFVLMIGSVCMKYGCLVCEQGWWSAVASQVLWANNWWSQVDVLLQGLFCIVLAVFCVV